jgi:hypothetical protein
MSLWEERASRNEALFRAVNERVEELHDRLESQDAIDFVCECADDACTERIVVPPHLYERVRSDPRRFLVVPGHERPELEHVVGEDQGFLVVEKDTPVAIDVAETTDPRD